LPGATSDTFIARVAAEVERKLGWPIPRTMEEASHRVQAMGAYASDLTHRMAENRTFYD
jgi:hypothetical protein